LAEVSTCPVGGVGAQVFQGCLKRGFSVQITNSGRVMKKAFN